MMKSKTTNFLLAGLLSLSFGSAFAASSSTGPVKPETGGVQSGSAVPPGTHPAPPSGSTKADATGRASDSGAGKSVDGGTTGSSVGKAGGPGKNGPNGTGGGAAGSDDN
ncbi:hypothetical protein [Pseudomonas caspiana]|uniref:Uncharacterized protein n=1 Tax=Pseudomonas caspiana TaxID=1451454 RepID=A0A1Y3P6Y6_9PSED|nr:hypothetical protein [Pseudomonas caspiana]OUM75605.1 hypothetical protein AUC60_00370 [Pseudomonas caspiana]